MDGVFDYWSSILLSTENAVLKIYVIDELLPSVDVDIAIDKFACYHE